MLLRLEGAAFAALLVMPAAVAATTPQRADAVIVTASRFANDEHGVPTHVSVIDRREIQRSPAVSIPDLLKGRAGIDSRPLYGPLGLDATVDMRGFGDSATSNTLVLIDGVRLNPVDASGIDWSAIPRESIERIEIIRGSGAVLYGDRAVGGVINIVTDKSARPYRHVEIGVGSYDYRDISLAARGGVDAFSYQAAASWAETDGWRDNNDADRRAANARLGWFFGDDSELFVNLAAFGDSTGQPGSIAEADYRTRPTFARTPDDRGRSEGYRLRPGLSHRLGETLDLAIESGVEHRRTVFESPSFGSQRDSDTVFVTPRLRWRHDLATLPSETVLGMDWYHAEVEADTDSSFTGVNRQSGRQISRAVYLQNTSRLSAALQLAVGFRRQEVDQRATDRQAALSGQATRSRNAHEIGLAWQASEALKLHVRSGRVFRFANTDELFGFDPETFASVFAGDLKPQQGDSHELGASYRRGPLDVHMALFRLDLEDEIGFNSETFANENFADTRRQGVEVEAGWQLDEALLLRLALTRQSAEFREGQWSGNQIPLVPSYQASLTAAWDGGGAGRWSAIVRDVGERRYSGDFTNSRKRLSGYTTADLTAEWQVDAWSVKAQVLNLFDQRYAPFALYSSFRDDFFYFPADPRSVFVSARYRFD
ncbi:MAG: TonB-dependent receptor [Rhodocyclaceae bacterium]|nr:TonB-dependent receptor [Rhodocyclaceae bacterium]